MLSLFTKKREQVESQAVAAAPEPIVPAPVAAQCSLEVDEEAEYLRVAWAAGLDSDIAPLLELRLKRMLRDENIRVYDTNQVCKFLDQKLGKDWKWLPLRQSDLDHMPRGVWSHTVHGNSHFFAATRYNRPIPLPVLLTVQKIAERMPEVHYYVSGIEQDADPFLCVATKLLSPYIIERWDEPDYRER